MNTKQSLYLLHRGDSPAVITEMIKSDIKRRRQLSAVRLLGAVVLASLLTMLIWPA